MVFDDFIHVADTLRFFCAGPVEHEHISYGGERRRPRVGLGAARRCRVSAASGRCTAAAAPPRRRSTWWAAAARRGSSTWARWSTFDGTEQLRRRPGWASAPETRGFTAMIGEFLDAVRTGEVLSARDALETHALCERVVDRRHAARIPREWSRRGGTPGTVRPRVRGAVPAAGRPTRSGWSRRRRCRLPLPALGAQLRPVARGLPCDERAAGQPAPAVRGGLPCRRAVGGRAWSWPPRSPLAGGGWPATWSWPGVLGWLFARGLGLVLADGFRPGLRHVVRARTTPSFPNVPLSLLVAVVAAAAPYLTRRVRWFGFFLAALLVPVELYLGVALPRSLGCAVVVGWGVRGGRSPALRLARRPPDTRPGRDRAARPRRASPPPTSSWRPCSRPSTP